MFSFFAQFWSLAFFVHYSEDWEKPFVILISLMLVLAMSRVKDKALLFFGSLSFYIIYYLSSLPFLANHSNFYLLISIFVWLWMTSSWIKHRSLTEDQLNLDFISVRQTLCLSLFILYFMAGFHKLNWDFLNPDVSCATNFFLRYSWEDGIKESIFPTFLLEFSPYLVLGLELLGALFLLTPALQIYGIFMFVGLHSYLVPLSFYDFASICYAILLCFLPLNIFQGEENLKRAQKGMRVLIELMVIGSLFARVIIYLDWDQMMKHDLAQGWFFIVGSFYFMHKLYLNIKAEGYSISTLPSVNLIKHNKNTPYWMYTFPLFLIFFTNTSYLGLRTAGNTTMFSNLKTEGGASNHIFISSAWQPFDFQKDLVFIKSVPHEYAYYKKGQPAPNMWMTAFELRRTVELWRKKGAVVPMKIRYNDELKDYKDIVTAEEWSQPLPWLLQKTLQFRPIQAQTPNRYRW